MSKSDLIVVGLKLFGIYFFVNGVIAIVAITAGLILDLQQGELGAPVYWNDFHVDILSFLQPVIFLVCAYLLVRRTQWCYRIICPEDARKAESPVDSSD